LLRGEKASRNFLSVTASGWCDCWQKYVHIHSEKEKEEKETKKRKKVERGLGRIGDSPNIINMTKSDPQKLIGLV